MDCVPIGTPVTSVVTDNFGAAYEAVRYLIGLGHRKIAAIFGHLTHSSVMDRVEGYRKAMKESNLQVSEEYHQQGSSLIESGHLRAMNVLKSPTPPTAIFAMNNRMTLGVLRALRELGIPCPERVSVVGFDDFDWAAVFNPTLTAVAQPTYDIGAQAVELLLECIQSAAQGLQVAPRQIVLKSSLRIRESTGPAPKT